MLKIPNSYPGNIALGGITTKWCSRYDKSNFCSCGAEKIYPSKLCYQTFAAVLHFYYNM